MAAFLFFQTLAAASAVAGELPPPQTFVVTDSSDTDDGTCDADCTLREAIDAANALASADTIRFSAPMTITLGSSLPELANDLTIDGEGQAVTIEGNDFKIFYGDFLTLVLDGLAINRGFNPANGGAVGVRDSFLTVRDCSFEGNRADLGGAIFGWVSIVIVDNSAFFGNQATSMTGGGAVHLTEVEGYVENSTFGSNSGAAAFKVEGTLYVGILHCTFMQNTTALATELTGYATVGLGNSILAGSTNADCVSAPDELVFSTNNLIEDGTCVPFLTGSPNLATAANNGGPTRTFALNAGSPALDVGDSDLCEGAGPADQRGVLRPIGAGCDLGAYEYGTAACGNGFLEGGEECDDGNLASGDCCSATCTAEADAQPCAADAFDCTTNECLDGACVAIPDDELCDDGSLCTTDTCSPTYGCLTSALPRPYCENNEPAKTSISIKNGDDPAKRSVTFKWGGASFGPEDFGTPASTTDYALCVYDDGTLVAELEAMPGGSMCGDQPCWKEADTSVKYKDASKPVLSDGVSGISGKSSSDLKGKMMFKAKGTSVPAFPLGTGMGIGLPVFVQVRTSNAGCWEGRFPQGSASKNSSTEFKAKF